LTPPEDEQLINDSGDVTSDAGDDHDAKQSEIDHETKGNDGGQAEQAQKDDIKAEEEEENIPLKKKSVVELLNPSEDDEITFIAIPAYQIVSQDHTIYQILVENEHIEDENVNTWTVMKRFEEFAAFHSKFTQAIVNDYPSDVDKVPPIPEKHLKLWVDHLDPVFIEKRRLLLQSYLRSLVKYKRFRNHYLLLKFLGIR
jgi:hypothetical protein